MVLERGVCIEVIVRTPDDIKKVFLGYDLSSVFRKSFQQKKLFRRKAQILAVEKCLPQVWIDFQSQTGNQNEVSGLALARR